jgi:hypothetical protein
LFYDGGDLDQFVFDNRRGVSQNIVTGKRRFLRVGAQDVGQREGVASGFHAIDVQFGEFVDVSHNPFHVGAQTVGGLVVQLYSREFRGFSNIEAIASVAHGSPSKDPRSERVGMAGVWEPENVN